MTAPSGPLGKNSSGELGNGTQDDSYFPQKIEDEGVVAAWTSMSSSIYLKSDGTLWGMGNNSNKILQNINQSKILQPVQIATGVSKAAVGDNHLIYLDLNGTLWGRGRNLNGELGQLAGNEYRDPVVIISGGGDRSGRRELLFSGFTGGRENFDLWEQ